MDDKIKEVMGLVDELVGESMAGGMCSIATNPDVAKQAPDFAKSIATLKSGIESKLRELVPVWLPIESAPKDGSFGIYWSEKHGANVWNKPEGCAGGLWKIIDGRLCGHACHGFDEATHWMPLPKEPQ